MQRYALRDDQSTKIRDFLPGREGHVGGTAADNRLFVDALLLSLPHRHPLARPAGEIRGLEANPQAFRRWCESGVFARVLEALALEADAEYMSMNSTSVRAHQHSAGAQKKHGADQAIGQSRGGLTTKIHAIVDALGNPVALSLTPGQAADITQADPLLDQVAPDAFLADKGYDSDALVETLQKRGIAPVIPPKANRREPRETDFALYRERNLVERFFCKLKQYRAIATRYDKLANTFLAAVTMVCILFWIN